MRPWLLAVLVLGCAAHRPVTLPTAGTPGTLTLSFAPDLGWPYRADKTLVAVDGALASWGSIPLGAGWHSVAVQVDLTVPCSVFSAQRAHIRVRTSQAFFVGDAPVALRLHLFEGSDASQPYEDRVRVRWLVVGEARDLSEQTPAVCAVLAPGPRAQCHVAKLLENAKAQRDVIAATCYRDKLLQIEALLPAEKAGDKEAVKKILYLHREALDCIGEEGCYGGPTIVTEEACGPELPEPGS